MLHKFKWSRSGSRFGLATLITAVGALVLGTASPAAALGEIGSSRGTGFGGTNAVQAGPLDFVCSPITGPNGGPIVESLTLNGTFTAGGKTYTGLSNADITLKTPAYAGPATEWEESCQTNQTVYVDNTGMPHVDPVVPTPFANPTVPGISVTDLVITGTAGTTSVNCGDVTPPVGASVFNRHHRYGANLEITSWITCTVTDASGSATTTSPTLWTFNGVSQPCTTARPQCWVLPGTVGPETVAGDQDFGVYTET